MDAVAEADMCSRPWVNEGDAVASHHLLLLLLGHLRDRNSRGDLESPGIDRYTAYTQSGPAILTDSSSFVLHAPCEGIPIVTWPIVRLSQPCSDSVISTTSFMVSDRQRADLCMRICLVPKAVVQ